MYPNRRKIDVKVGVNAGSSSVESLARGRSPLPVPKNASLAVSQRDRSTSTTSSLSILSPVASSSTSSLQIPAVSHTPHVRDRRSYSLSPTSPIFDDTVRLGPDYVLAMHDFSPQRQNDNCLSFRAGQVIRVWNRDSSGWWDGELEGRRGWFPSNYVSADVNSLTEEELPGSQKVRCYHCFYLSL